MPFVETPEDLADHLADRIGVYGAHSEGETEQCRICFVDEMSRRIVQAVRNQETLGGSATSANVSENAALGEFVRDQWRNGKITTFFEEVGRFIEEQGDKA